MDRQSVSIIHSTLPNQKLYAEYLYRGFSKLGYNVECTTDKVSKSDLVCVIGPHYALKENLNPNTIYIDRCLWGDDLEFVTIGFIDDRGGMLYPKDAPSDRPKPELKPWKQGTVKSPLFLCDYGPYPKELGLAKKIYPDCRTRPHPATRKQSKSLLDQLSEHDCAIGFRTSALVTAAIEGYPVISLDYRSPVYPVASNVIGEIVRPNRTQWLNNLSYAQWSGKEIESGEALRYVIDNRTH